MNQIGICNLNPSIDKLKDNEDLRKLMRKKAESVIDEYTVVFTLKDFPNYHLICSLQVSRLHIVAKTFMEFYLK